MDVHCCFTAGACFFVLIEQIINITVYLIVNHIKSNLFLSLSSLEEGCRNRFLVSYYYC